MEFERAVRRRRTVRAFTDEPVAPALIDEICDLARRSPSAGNACGVEFLVLEGADTAGYWNATLPVQRRAGFAWPGLLRAPALVVVWSDPGAYLRRYSEPDKRHTGLGADAAAWPVPYWFVDGGAAVMTLLLAAQDRGLGAAFFGVFAHEDALRRRFGVPAGRRAVGTVALGRPAPDRPSRSALRGRPELGAVVHRGRWQRRGPEAEEIGRAIKQAQTAAGSDTAVASGRVSETRVPLVSYLRLEPEPHLVAHECRSCGARFFDRRNACARCGENDFAQARVDDRGEMAAFTIVHRAAPGIPVPFVSAVVKTADGTWVRSNLVNCDPTPEAVTLGMAVRLTTYPIGADDDGTEAVAFGYEPA